MELTVSIKRLDWDSRFFQKEVFRVFAPAGLSLYDWDAVRQQLTDQQADLAYIFVPETDENFGEKPEEIGAVLYDQKVTFHKNLSAVPGLGDWAPAVSVYAGPLIPELRELSLIAGADSRFNKDPRLKAYFPVLYEQWMTNSLSRQIADQVFVYRVKDRIVGMLTCALRQGTGQIGLIATLPGFRGQGIGKALVHHAENYYRTKQVYASTVVTQYTNQEAMLFYQRAGFAIQQVEYVYHFWLN